MSLEPNDPAAAAREAVLDMLVAAGVTDAENALPVSAPAEWPSEQEQAGFWRDYEADNPGPAIVAALREELAEVRRQLGEERERCEEMRKSRDALMDQVALQLVRQMAQSDYEAARAAEVFAKSRERIRSEEPPF